MVVSSRLQFINKRRSHLRKVWRSWTSSCSMSLADRSSRSEGDWWLIGVQLAVRAPLTFPRLCGESVSVASFYIHGPSHPHLPVSRRVVSSEPPLIKTVPLKSLNPGSQEAALQGPAGSLVCLPPPPLCRSRVFLRHDSTAFGATAASRTQYAQTIKAGPVLKLLSDWNTNWSSLRIEVKPNMPHMIHRHMTVSV